MKHNKLRYIPFQALTWLVILSQVFTSAAFADIKVFSKATLAPRYISQNIPETEARRLSMELSAVGMYAGRLYFTDGKDVNELSRPIRDQFRNYKFLNCLKLDPDLITHSDTELNIPFDNPLTKSRQLIRITRPDGYNLAIDFPMQNTVTRDSNGKTVSFTAEAMAEPLIGHGFKAEELDKAVVTLWSESDAFQKVLAELEQVIVTRASDKIKQPLLDTIKNYKEGKDGRRIGVTSSVYENPDRYYLGFGTSRSIALGREYLDKNNPLNKYAIQALFHEVFHAMRMAGSAKNDDEHYVAAHFEAMQAATHIFWGLGKGEFESVSLEDLENHPNNELGEEIREWKTNHMWAVLKTQIRPAVNSGDSAFIVDCLRFLLKKPDRNAPRLIELLGIWDSIFRKANGEKLKAEGLVTQVIGALTGAEKFSFSNIICKPKYASLYYDNLIVKQIMVGSSDEIARQVLQNKVNEVAGGVVRNPAYLWDREIRGLRDSALEMLKRPETIIKTDIDILAEQYSLYRKGGLSETKRARAQELKTAMGLQKGEVIGYDSLEYATAEDLLLFAGGLGALAGDHAKAASDLLPAGTFVCVGGYYKFGYLNQVIDQSNFQQALYERMRIENWGEIVKDSEGNDIIIELPMPDGKTIYAKAWKMEMGRTDLYLMTTDIDENNANLHYKSYLDYTYDANDERRIVQEYVIGVGGERLLEKLGMQSKALHLNEGHVAFAILEKARRLLSEKIDLLNEQTSLGYSLKNLGNIPIEERRKLGLTLEQALEAVRHMVVFTSHTPIAAGNQKFPYHIAERYLDAYLNTFGGSFGNIAFEPNVHDGVFDMTEFAITYTNDNAFNGVARKHAEVCRDMYKWSNAKVRERFGRNRPEATNVTNAVNREYYQPEEMQALLESKLETLKTGGMIDKDVTLDNISWIDSWKVVNAVTDAEMEAVSKKMLENGIRELKAIRSQSSQPGSRILPTTSDIDPNAFIIVFGRRMTGYKRPDYILDKDGDLDIEAWRAVVREARSKGRNVQLIYTGKAHPADDPLKAKLQKILHIAMHDSELRGTILFIENYNTQIAKALVKISTAALNNPVPPEEASGTSGMKYSLAGKANITVMDGWTLEALRDGSLWGVYPFANRHELKEVLWGEWRFVSKAGVCMPGRDAGKRVLTHELETRDGKNTFECLDPQCRHVWATNESDAGPTVCPKCSRPAIKSNSYAELGLMDAYFNNKARWNQIMRESLAMSLSYFTSHRMFMEYATKMYMPTLKSSETAKREFMAIGLDPLKQTPDAANVKDLKGPKAPDSNTVISDLIKNGKMLEVTVEDGVLKAYPVRYIDGYRPGVVDPNRYCGPPVDALKIFNTEEAATFKRYIEEHPVNGKAVKFRIVFGESAIGWKDDVEHSNIAHAGERDGVIYIGEKLLRRLMQRTADRLRKSILDDDELEHLKGRGHGTDEDYRARLELVKELLKNIEARESLISVALPDFSSVSLADLVRSAPTIEEDAGALLRMGGAYFRIGRFAINIINPLPDSPRRSIGNIALEPERVAKEYEAIRTATRTIAIPDLREFSLGPAVWRSPGIDEYYETHKEEKGVVIRITHTEKGDIYRGQTDYIFPGIGIINKKGDWDEYRIIKQKKIYDPQGAYEGELLIYYSERENAITVLLEGPDAHAPVIPGSDLARGGEGWDRAVIKIYLDGKADRISMIDHRVTEMGLSRSTMAIMLTDSGIGSESGELYKALKTFFVFHEVDDWLRLTEKRDNIPIPTKLLNKVSRNPESATEDDIKTLEDFMYYKSWTVRSLALDALKKTAEKGVISQARLKNVEMLFDKYRIEEDFLFIERMLTQDPALIPDIFKNLFGEDVSRDGIGNIRVKWYRAGKVKNIYRIVFTLKDGRKFKLATSTIRHDPLGGGYGQEAINTSQGYWSEISKRTPRRVAKFGAQRWALAYRPCIADSSLQSGMTVQDPRGVGQDHWILNNISIVFREFVEGKDLDEILADPDISDSDKAEAKRSAIQDYLDIWNDTKDDTGKGLLIGDPKPANIVMSKQNGAYSAKVIDMDALRQYDGLDKIIEVIACYPEYDGFDVILKNGKAIAIEKPGQPVNISISLGGTKVGVGIVNAKGEVAVMAADIKWHEVYGDDATADDMVETIMKQVVSFLDRGDTRAEDITEVGIAFAGPVDEDTGIVGTPFKAPNLPLDHYPLKARLEALLKAQFGRDIAVTIYNDSKAALLGEMSPKGLLAGKSSGGIMIIGTGVNITVAKSGKAYFGAKGEIRELGHNLVAGIGSDGEWHYRFTGLETLGDHPKFAPGEMDFEDRNSGPNLDKRFKEASSGKFGIKEITQAARDGDDLAVQLIRQVGEEIGRGIAAFQYAYRDEPFVYDLVLVSSVSENIGKGVLDESGKDLFINAVQRAAAKELVAMGMKSVDAEKAGSGIVRSAMTYERELVAFTPKEADTHSAKIERDMAAIHDINMELLPAVENGKVLYQVITEELIPGTMIGHIQRLARETENLKLRERIRIVKRKDLQSETARLKSSSNNIVLAAVQCKEDLLLLPKDVKALVFTGADGGAYGFRQIEGIWAALRALYRGDTPTLAKLYKILTGTPFTGKESDILKYVNDPQVLAGIITFNLEPAAAKDGEEHSRLNKRLLEFLYKA